jgi:hypothetical protein
MMLLTTLHDWILFIVLTGKDIRRFDFSRDDQNSTAPVMPPLSIRLIIPYVRFQVFTAVTMKKAVFWDVAPCRCGATSQKTAFFNNSIVAFCVLNFK